MFCFPIITLYFYVSRPFYLHLLAIESMNNRDRNRLWLAKCSMKFPLGRYHYQNIICGSKKTWQKSIVREAREQGYSPGIWRSGESTRLSPLCVARGQIPEFTHLWLEFVVRSRPCTEGFSPGCLGFLPPQKPAFSIPIRCGNIG